MTDQHTQETGRVLWRPHADAREQTAIGRFMTWGQKRWGVPLPDYDSLWRFSTSELGEFWGGVVDFLGVSFDQAPTAAIGRKSMPGAEWFPGSKLNYASHALRGEDGQIVLESRSQSREAVSREPG